LAPKIAKSREILPKFDLTAVQGHLRSSILVSIESAFVTSWRKWLIFTTAPLFEAPARGNPLEFLDETYLAKTKN